MAFRRRALLAVIGPGLLVAATGVGAGDLATAGFAGSRLGVAVMWAVLVGAACKFVLNEGLARWQLATGQTLLDGAIERFGPLVTVGFLAYLLPWTFFVGAALISACGVTLHAIIPVFDEATHARFTWGIAHSVLGVVIAWFGGFRIFERVMAGLIAVMFVTVVLTACLLGPDLFALCKGLLVPTIPEAASGGLTWTIALVGGVGGTLTILCYGYWMRERDRRHPQDLATCRIDLACAYSMTALFGMAMIVIAARTEVTGSGADLIVNLAATLEGPLGPAGRWLFLVGAWAAVCSSLLGVWQAVPYIFADAWRHIRTTPGPAVSTRSAPYRIYLLALAIVPLVQVSHPFRQVQKYYALIGAAFIPLLAVSLLVLNGRRIWTGALRNRPATTVALAAILVISLVAGFVEVARRWGG
jgi:Mn2+/Fe2+ NRAMP family transporter